MNNISELDTFETALLAELRREVVEHPAPAPAHLMRSPSCGAGFSRAPAAGWDWRGATG